MIQLAQPLTGSFCVDSIPLPLFADIYTRELPKELPRLLGRGIVKAKDFMLKLPSLGYSLNVVRKGKFQAGHRLRKRPLALYFRHFRRAVRRPLAA